MSIYISILLRSYILPHPLLGHCHILCLEVNGLPEDWFVVVGYAFLMITENTILINSQTCFSDHLYYATVKPTLVTTSIMLQSNLL